MNSQDLSGAGPELSFPTPGNTGLVRIFPGQSPEFSGQVRDFQDKVRNFAGQVRQPQTFHWTDRR